MPKITSIGFAAAVIALVLLAILIPDRQVILLALAISTLACGSVFAVLFSENRGVQMARDIRSLLESQSSLSGDLANFKRKLNSALEQSDADDREIMNEQLTQQVKSLEMAVTSLSHARRGVAAAMHASEQANQDPVESAGSPAEQTVSAFSSSNRREFGLRQSEAEPEPEKIPEKTPDFHAANIHLYLEPIVDIRTNSTAHYRATLAVHREDDTIVPSETYHDQLRISGHLREFELLLFERLAPAIEKLHQRGRNAGVFCPVSAESFADDQFIEGLLRFVENNRDIAGYLIIEVTQQALSDMAEKGLNGLAHLAELGALFSMQEARIRMPEASMLKSLNFGFIDIDVKMLGRALLTPGASGGTFASDLQSQELAIIVSNVSEHSDIEDINEFVSLGRGPLYSPPRRVRPTTVCGPAAQKIA